MFLYKGKDQGKKKRSYKAPSPAILTTTIWELETKELSKTKQTKQSGRLTWQPLCLNCLNWAVLPSGFTGKQAVHRFSAVSPPSVKIQPHSLVPSRDFRSSGRRVFHRSTSFGWIISGTNFRSPIALAPHNFPKLASTAMTWRQRRDGYQVTM